MRFYKQSTIAMKRSIPTRESFYGEGPYKAQREILMQKPTSFQAYRQNRCMILRRLLTRLLQILENLNILCGFDRGQRRAFKQLVVTVEGERMLHRNVAQGGLLAHASLIAPDLVLSSRFFHAAVCTSSDGIRCPLTKLAHNGRV